MTGPREFREHSFKSSLGMQETVVCVLAKPPDGGDVKTRLVPLLGPDGARDLAWAFLSDTVQAICGLPWARCILATTFPHGDAFSKATSKLTVWDQGEGCLGDRMERMFQRALQKAGSVIVVGTDSPGLPLDRLEEAHRLLSCHDAVIGPAEDGGFYLLGLNCYPEGLLHGIPWSCADTCEKTLGHLRAFHLDVAVLETWFDVDRPDDITRLFHLLEGGKISAPETLAVLLEMKESLRLEKLSPSVSTRQVRTLS